MSAIISGRVYWTEFQDLSYTDRNKKQVNIKETTAKIVMLAIADSADDFGENSWQSFETIATKSSIERRSAIRVVRALVNAEFLKIAGITKYGTNNFSVNIAKLGNPPTKRARIGRPKIGDSEAKTSDPEALIGDSEAKTSDPQSPDPLINPSLIPPLTGVEKISFDEDKADITWALLGGKKVTQRQLDKQKAIKDFEDMLEFQFKRFPLNWIAFDEKAKDLFRRFLKELPEGESLEKFVNWWMSDERRVSTPPYTLAIVMQRWPQAFAGKQKQSAAEPKPLETPFTKNLETWTYYERPSFDEIKAARKNSSSEPLSE